VHAPPKDAQTLLREADMALYAAKAAGRNQAKVFNAAMLAAMEAREGWVMAVLQALRNGRLELYVQPILRVHTDGRDDACSVSAAEVLLRLRGEHGRLHAAGEFEAVLDDGRVARPVGRWVLEQATHWLERWKAEGNDLSLAVNISPRHFLGPHFPGDLREVLQAHPDLPTQALVLEVTERGVALDTAATSARIEACRALGVQVSLDDFGTGNASLIHLQSLATSTIKIDRGFVQDILHDARDLSITFGILRMAQLMGAQAVAEGVETPRIAQVLVAMGCVHLQGWAVARPMSAARLGAWLRNWPQQLQWAAHLGKPGSLGADGIEAIVSLGTTLRMLLTGGLDNAMRSQLLAPSAHLNCCALGRWCQQHSGQWGRNPGFLRLTQQHLELHARIREWILFADQRTALEPELQALGATLRQEFWDLNLSKQAQSVFILQNRAEA
jgi:EAL domain-containing protein (putative c-di-GMP-specific phosphodiesterase class I)